MEKEKVLEARGRKRKASFLVCGSRFKDCSKECEANMSKEEEGKFG